MNQALYAHMNNKRKMKKKKGSHTSGSPSGAAGPASVVAAVGNLAEK
jgi:hypothetical protein